MEPSWATADHRSSATFPFHLRSTSTESIGRSASSTWMVWRVLAMLFVLQRGSTEVRVSYEIRTRPANEMPYRWAVTSVLFSVPFLGRWNGAGNFFFMNPHPAVIFNSIQIENCDPGQTLRSCLNVQYKPDEDIPDACKAGSAVGLQIACNYQVQSGSREGWERKSLSPLQPYRLLRFVCRTGCPWIALQSYLFLRFVCRIALSDY